ncbi:MAG: ABC-F family ATP-binding cassette domain-containing protein [Clostridiales Family XIII bacterium]|jgi:ATP-binding cassette subfamily F protein 3|nr:ABC-F family ATP-binding cassette domain-containing protein [Clostridiales Family XIII bacterium]
MIALSASGLCKSYGACEVLKNVSFHLDRGDRVGVIGANGAGKTTLMNILTGQIAPDEGDFFVAPGLSVAYLKQGGNFRQDGSVYDEIMAVFGGLVAIEGELDGLSREIAAVSGGGGDTAGLLAAYDALTEEYRAKNGYGFRSEIKGVLGSMAFSEDDFGKKVSTLSGGERTRLALAALLLQKPDILFLDEPTNHLDIGMLRWLEQYLRNYDGTIALVSHDRYFLDQTVNRIFEIESHALHVYEGSYSAFAEKKRARRKAENELYERQQREIRRQEDMIRRFRQHGTEKLAKRARSREMQLSRIERAERPEGESARMGLRFRQNIRSGGDVLRAEGLSKGFGCGAARRELFSDVDMDVKNGEHICVVGANGTGKTTLLKIMGGAMQPDGGWLRLGHNVEIGYYDQEQELLVDERSVLEEMTSSYRLYSETEMRGMLGRFMFRGDAVFQRTGSLSGGERARLSLLKVMLSGANLLLLDEPTNHLDIVSKEVFEDALCEFPGTAIIVSHDRYLLNKAPSRILELTAGGLECYLGGYESYAAKKEALASEKNRPAAPAAPAGQDAGRRGAAGQTGGGTSDAAESRRRSKAEQTELRRREKRLAALEERIVDMEGRVKALEEAMCGEDVFSDHALLLEYGERLRSAKTGLEQAYEAWIEAQS